MGSASREALNQAKSTLSDSLGASTGGEVLSASAQLSASPALASALGDPAADVAAKTQLVNRVFASASADARSLLAAAASGRWSNQAEFIEGVEELGLRAEAIANTDLPGELLAVADLVRRNHDLELTLSSKLGAAEGKAALVRRLLEGKISASALTVVAHLASNQRGRRLDASLRESARVAADQRGSELATVTVAAPLASGQQERLARMLEKSAGRNVLITTVVDPDLIGGVRIQIADDIIDGSVRARLDDLRLQLAA
ncbi:MAG: ATP synthase F1 subunit delta [Leucobacter sp.]